MPILKNIATDVYENVPQEEASKLLTSGSHLVPLNDPEDNPVTVPYEEAQALLTSGKGFTQPTSDQLKYLVDASKHQTSDQTLKAIAEQAASAATFGQSTKLETMAGVKPEDIRSRAEGLSGVPAFGAQAAGLLGSAALGPLGAAKWLGTAGKAAAGAAEAAGVGRIGQTAAQFAIENAMISGGDEASKMYAHDPDQTIANAAAHVGMSGLLGAGLGAGFGTAGSAWEGLSGAKTAELLTAVKNKMAEIENPALLDGVEPNPLQESIKTAGIGVLPELQAGMQGDPALNRAFQILQESATGPGHHLQEALSNFRKEAADGIIKTLGKTPEEVEALGDYSKFDAGKSIASTLEREIKEVTDPLSNDFDAINNRYSTVKLGKLKRDAIANKIYEFAQENKYDLPGTPQNSLVDNVVHKWLPTVNTLEDLKGIETLVSQQTGGFAKQELWHVGGGLKNIFREYETQLVERRLAEKEPDLVGAYRTASATYAKEKANLNQLNDRLSLGRFTGPKTFLKRLSEMAPEDVYNRLTHKGDVGLLNLLGERYPQTAEAIKMAHVNNLMKAAAAKAKDPLPINLKTLFSTINTWSPELRKFALTQYQLDRANSLGSLLEKFPDRMGPSGTPKALAHMMSNVPAGVGGFIALVTGHNPISGAIFGLLSKYASTEVPDAMRLSLLKVMGSSGPVSAPGFKAAVQVASAMLKGIALTQKAAKAVFQTGNAVIPNYMYPDQKTRDKIKKRIDELQSNNDGLFDVGKDIGHYLPDHGIALGATVSRTIGYLQSVRPKTARLGTLDPETEPSQIEQDNYNRALDIAEQPLITLESIKDGTLTPSDVTAFKTMYPSLYSGVSMKLQEEMINHVSKDQEIPYATRLNLSLFLGEPLDASMTQSSIALNQIAVPSSAPTQNPHGQGHTQGSTKALGKSNAMAQTAIQSRQASHASA